MSEDNIVKVEFINDKDFHGFKIIKENVTTKFMSFGLKEELSVSTRYRIMLSNGDQLLWQPYSHDGTMYSFLSQDPTLTIEYGHQDMDSGPFDSILKIRSKLMLNHSDLVQYLDQDSWKIFKFLIFEDDQAMLDTLSNIGLYDPAFYEQKYGEFLAKNKEKFANMIARSTETFQCVWESSEIFPDNQ